MFLKRKSSVLLGSLHHYARSLFQLIILTSFFITSIFLEAKALQVDIKGDAALLINADSGAILLEKNAFTSFYPASATKIATALYVLELKRNELELPITAQSEALASISQEKKRRLGYREGAAYWLEPDASNIGLKLSEVMSLHNLLKGMLIRSGGDAANVLAHEVGGSIPNFMEGLNAYLKEIGCQDTYFSNPHGLHDPKHLSTANDLALITRKALQDPTFCEMVSQKAFNRPKTNKQPAGTFLQTNRLLRPGRFYYSKAIGVKTGYHSKAKNTFIGAARHLDRTLIVVLLGYPDRNTLFQEAIHLFEMAFNEAKIKRIYLKSGPQLFKKNLLKASEPVETYLDKELCFEYYPAEDPLARCFLSWDSIALPILKNQRVGELQLISERGELLDKSPLLASKDIYLKWPHNWIFYFSSNFWKLVLISGFFVLIVMVFVLRRFGKR